MTLFPLTSSDDHWKILISSDLPDGTVWKSTCTMSFSGAEQPQLNNLHNSPLMVKNLNGYSNSYKIGYVLRRDLARSVKNKWEQVGPRLKKEMARGD